MNVLARFGLVARRGVGRVLPDPWSLAIALTFLVLAVATVARRDPIAVLGDWIGSRGFWGLLPFAMQMLMMLILGTALASAPLFERLLVRTVAWPRSPRQLVAWVSALSIGLSLFNWSVGLIGGALLAREAGRRLSREGWAVHYPIVCAAGYSGMMTWHGGLSGSAPLKAASASGMEEIMGAELALRLGVISVQDTLLSPLNLVVTGGLWVLGPCLFAALMPPSGSDPDPMPPPHLRAEHLEPELAPSSWVERVERSSWWLRGLGGLMLLALAHRFGSDGSSALDVDTVNLLLWGAAMGLHASPVAFLQGCAKGLQSGLGIVLQFPLYAGIMGVLVGSGARNVLAAWMAGIGAPLFVLVGFLSAGALNLIIPSGGGQWAIQGPVLMDGALASGVRPAYAVLALAYGDQWTNMLQPFWALPLLALTGVRARDIVGYSAIWMAVGGLWIAGWIVIFVLAPMA